MSPAGKASDRVDAQGRNERRQSAGGKCRPEGILHALYSYWLAAHLFEVSDEVGTSPDDANCSSASSASHA